MQNFEKFSGNPILGSKELGTCFDVYVWQDNGKYRMDFSWRRENAAAVCFSDDGINWTYPKITLPPTKKSGWEERINRTCVIKVGGVYKMYYTGQSSEFSYIGLAQSDDGIRFKRLSDEPILVPEFPYEGYSVMNPCVLYEGGVYKMWYSAGETFEPNYICYAESEDGIHFKKRKANPIFVRNRKNKFECDRLGGCQVLHTPDMGYLMFYIGYENINTARICVARSDDGITNWERCSLNPIVGPTVGEWDEDATYKPSAIWIPELGEWRVYYNGRRKHDEYIGFSRYNKRRLFEKPSLARYVDTFNFNDEETVVNAISNKNAYDYLHKYAPTLECPDKTVEETFAFRAWTIRKHIKETEYGTLMTEFLPSVPWAGEYNTINAPLFHHLNEYRWFKNADKLIDYLDFFLENKGGNAYRYSTPALTAMYEFLLVTGNETFIRENAELFEKYFAEWERIHQSENGLYWSIDNYDAMEWSISGSTPEPCGEKIAASWKSGGEGKRKCAKALKGLRPTLNAYMYGDAITLARIFESVGNAEKAELYRKKAEKIKSLVDEKLWDGEFYKAVHTEDINADISIKNVPDFMNVRELIGYNPWIYKMPDADKADMFKYLKDSSVFQAETGFATADISHPRYLYPFPHECLWNGYVWPYATSQVINATISLLDNYEQSVIDNADLYSFIKKYAEMHYIEDGRGRHSFIDEVMRPDKPIWESREILKNLGWREGKGGYERGKDYNHSTFIDLVIRGLIGVRTDSETLSVKPRISGIWKWFKLGNLTYKGMSYDIYYDEDGTKFGKGAGLIIEKI
ncbi:MAG: hypothetical protein IJD79_02165 [Clostridia bacterium]|nr:hypothetical protein [Clostridia bacterium]